MLSVGAQPRAVPYSAVSYEVFNLSGATKLYEPLSATSRQAAEAEVTGRWAWDRGDRFAIRELGGDVDSLHIYAVRRKSAGFEVWNGHIPSKAHERWLDHICTVDMNVIAGIPVGLIGSEGQLHERAQRRRPFGARLSREK